MLHILCDCGNLYSFRGTDFRKTFGMIGGLRALCDVPIMALTATASMEKQTSIVASLSML